MASKVSLTEQNYGPVIDMTELARDLLRRRAEIEAETGQPFTVPRNSGARRTESKKALLAEIDKLATAKGFRW